MSLREFNFLVDGEPRRISAEVHDGSLVVREAGRVLETEARWIAPNEIRFRVEGRPVKAWLVRDGERIYVAVDGREFVVAEFQPGSVRPGEADEKGAETGWRVKAPMPGKVTKIAVAAGDEVHKNQTLIIVEAMKMENEIKTAVDGIVAKVHVAVGDRVDAERPLIEIAKKSSSS
jgi:biotin carboxyl carrier protein